MEKTIHQIKQGERTTAIPQHITATAIVQMATRVDRPLLLKRRQ